jgi:putative oxidoreductase
MTAIVTAPAPAPVARRLHRTLWTMQVLLGVFFVVASAGPKLLGEPNTAQSFADMGAAPWFRYFIGLLELAGGIGLLVPHLAGLAATGLALLMVGATITQVVIVHGGVVLVTTPVVLFAFFVFIAWHRRASLGRLVRR